MKKIFIGNCNFNLDEEGLKSFIESNGVDVESVQVIRDRETNRSRGFGFAELAESQDLDQAVEALNGKELDGRPLTVNEARKPAPRTGGGGGGGNFGNRGGGKRRERW
jgi:RNA recognition motif-containing protein